MQKAKKLNLNREQKTTAKKLTEHSRKNKKKRHPENTAGVFCAICN